MNLAAIRRVETALLTIAVALGVASTAPIANAAVWRTAGLPYAEMGTAYLGVDVEDVTAGRVGPLKLKEERGAEIQHVDRDAPAGKIGLREHDVILEFDGNPVAGALQLRRMIHETPTGRKVKLGISRDGQPMTLEVKLADYGALASTNWPVPRPAQLPHVSQGFGSNMPSIADVPEQPDPGLPPYSFDSGMMVESLTPQLGEFFGARNGKGVLVLSVAPGSSAEAAGIRAGDVVRKIGDEAVADRVDFNRILRHRKPGSLGIVVLRDKREQTVTISLAPSQSRNDGCGSPLYV